MQSDVAVIGAGPAGLATAIAASLRGLRVTVIDSRKPPIDKACGEGLLPNAVKSLQSIGIELDTVPAVRFSGFRFSDEQSSASARIAGGKAFGLRRTALQEPLVQRCSDLGVSFRWGGIISEFDFGGVRVDGEFIRCDWLVGADGQGSAVRTWAGLGPLRYKRSRFGFRRHYQVAPWTDLVEVHWGERCQMIATPIGPEEVCIVLLSSDARLRIESAFAQFPEISKRLAGARPTSREAGAITALGRARAVVRKNVALVGDASCTIDGVAGQGISLAVCEAIHLADALARRDLASYEAAHLESTKLAMGMTRLLLLLDRNAFLRRKALRCFQANPRMFARMISLHMGESAEESLSPGTILNLGWQVLCA
jgi:2-polyprenyl-6-methoxyphenol hydroxylase-like FAD-dependent oxidoreductase